jgi:hypothetical protein
MKRKNPLIDIIRGFLVEFALYFVGVADVAAHPVKGVIQTQAFRFSFLKAIFFAFSAPLKLTA